MLATAKCKLVRQPTRPPLPLSASLLSLPTSINDWMKASRLRLNPAKTQIMWLGTSQQLDKVTVRDVPLLSTEWQSSIQHATSASLSIASCRWMHMLPTATLSSDGVSLSWCCQDTGAGIYIQSTGLLERTAVWQACLKSLCDVYNRSRTLPRDL